MQYPESRRHVILYYGREWGTRRKLSTPAYIAAHFLVGQHNSLLMLPPGEETFFVLREGPSKQTNVDSKRWIGAKVMQGIKYCPVSSVQ